MTPIEKLMPSAPSWRLDWDAVDGAFPWIRALKGSTQDPVHHAEGDVWTHVRMVVEELVASPDWRALPEDGRHVLFAAALLHDVAKPATWSDAEGRITNRGHSRVGAVMARAILWRMGMPLALREQACAVIRAHQTPFWLLERPEWEGNLILAETSLSVAPRLVAIHAEADARGRICADRQAILDGVELYRDAARELGCLDAPLPFANDHSRMRYFRSPDTASPRTALYDPTDPAFTVTLMSGLVAMGKSTWIRRETGPGGSLEGQPVISLDALRAEMGIPAEKEQGAVRQEAKERARVLLRRREPFVWDGTNVSRQIRSQVGDLFADYGARVRIAYVEAPAADMAARNRARREDMVPDAAIARMMDRWEFPTTAECHELLLAVAAAPRPVPAAGPGRGA